VLRVAQQTGVSASTEWKICRHGLPLSPYKMQLSQPLSEHGMGRRRGFAREYGTLLEEIPGGLNVTWLSDEAHFQ
jgi:hypothetical protein